MSAKEYVKADITNFADKVNALYEGAKDGVGSEDFGALIEGVTASAKIVNEVQDVPAAAGLHFAGRIADQQGDIQLAKAIKEEEAGDTG